MILPQIREEAMTEQPGRLCLTYGIAHIVKERIPWGGTTVIKVCLTKQAAERCVESFG